MAAEKISTVPKRIAITLVGMYIATKAPTTAPTVVAISRNIPMRTLVILSLMYAAAAPEEVAMEVTKAAPTAYRISTPNPNVSNGITTTPPHSPVNAPTIPAKMAPINRISEKVSMLTEVKSIIEIMF